MSGDSLTQDFGSSRLFENTTGGVFSSRRSDRAAEKTGKVEPVADGKQQNRTLEQHARNQRTRASNFSTENRGLVGSRLGVSVWRSS
jgi:hypothetical protein